AGLTLFAPRGLEQGLRRRSLVRVAPLIRHHESNSSSPGPSILSQMPRSVTAMLEGPALPITGSRTRENAWPRAVAHRSQVYSRSAGRLPHSAPDDLRTTRSHRCADALSLAPRTAIERQVERQHVHPRLAQQAEGTPLDVLLHQLPHAVFRQIAGFRNSGHLEKGRVGGDVRIEAAAGGRH